MTFPKERLGVLFILVGPGGVGKNALLNEALSEFNNLKQLPTATTRPIRPEERQGREHHFVTSEKFQHMIDSDELLEFQEVHPGRFYGVPRAVVEDAINTHKDRIADIDMLGAEIINTAYPENSTTIFIAPPSIDDLVARLKTRQASEKDINDRLNRLPMEMLFAPQSQYVIVNDQIDHAARELRAIIRHERGDTPEPGERFPLNDVTFKVCVIPTYGDQCLLPQDGTFPTTTATDDLQAPALDLIKNVLNINGDAAHLIYAKPDGSIPVHLDYTGRAYALTYHYLYRLPEQITPPEGWDWQPAMPEMGA